MFLVNNYLHTKTPLKELVTCFGRYILTFVLFGKYVIGYVIASSFQEEEETTVERRATIKKQVHEQ